MGRITIGPNNQDVRVENVAQPQIMPNFFNNPEPIVQEIIKEIPVYVEKLVEVPVEKVVYVDRPVEIIKEVVKEKPVYIEKFVEVPVEKIIYKDRIVEKEVIKIQELPIVEYKDIEKKIYVDFPVEKVVYKIPTWVFGIIGLETLLLIFLMVK